ncbi:hypothetical protein BDR03DRAFT_974537, partial [Suillus americanus]
MDSYHREWHVGRHYGCSDICHVSGIQKAARLSCCNVAGLHDRLEFVGLGCSTASTMNLYFASMIPTTVWEIITLFLTVRIVMKHFRELRQSLTGSTAGDCFRVLVESHAFYFLAFVTVACFLLGSVAIMVLQPVTRISSWPLSHHFSADHNFHGKCCLLWCLVNRRGIADVCVGTASGPQHSRTSRQGRGQDQRGNRHDNHCFPCWWRCIDRQRCVAHETMKTILCGDSICFIV